MYMYVHSKSTIISLHLAVYYTTHLEPLNKANLYET